MKTVRVGIIGQGRSGRDIHARYLKTDARFKIVAVADPIPLRRERAIQDFGCEAVPDYSDLLKRKDLDLIVNSSMSHQHVPITLEAFKAGFNVLCEKPLASRVKDVDRLIAASQKCKRVFAIYQQARFAPYFQQVQSVIKSGVLGRIVQINIHFNGFGRRWDWQTLQDHNGGNLMNTGPHPLDQALVLFGEGMPTVHCFMDRANTCGDAEDHVKLLLSGEGHPLIDLEISSCCAYPCFTYHVYGTRGGLKGTQTEMNWKYFKENEAPKIKLIETPLAKPDGTPSYCAGDQLTWYDVKWPSDESAPKSTGAYSAAAAPTQGGMTGSFYNMLYKTLTRGTALEITPEQVRRQIAVIELCHKQAPAIYGKRKNATAKSKVKR